MHHGVTLTLAVPKCVHLPYTSFSNDKDISIAATDYNIHFYIIVLFPLTAIIQLASYSFIIFSVLINAVILLLNCLVLKLYLYMHFLSLRCYFLHLIYIIWSLYN